MDPSIVHTLNDPALFAVRQYHLDRLERLFAGETLDKPFLLSGYGGSAQADPMTDPEKWVEETLADFAAHTELALDREVFRPFCLENWFYGVHFIDKVFGSRVEPATTEALWWSAGVENEVGELPIPDLATNETWKLAQRLTLACVESGVKLPFIATQVLGEPWNQLFNLYRERALYGFYDDPDGMKRDLAVVTDVLVEMHQWFLKNIPADQYQPIVPSGRFQPYGHGQMCGCSTHMISHDLYEEFVRPMDERITSLFPKGAMLHLCGNHVQHLASWSEMDGICAYQLNDRAIDDLETFYKKRRPGQILYLNPYENMPVSRILELTEGGRGCVIVSDHL